MIIIVTCSTSTLIDLIVTSSLPANIRLDEDVFKTFSRRLQEVLQKGLLTSSRRLQDVLSS